MRLIPLCQKLNITALEIHWIFHAFPMLAIHCAILLLQRLNMEERHYSELLNTEKRHYSEPLNAEKRHYSEPLNAFPHARTEATVKCTIRGEYAIMAVAETGLGINIFAGISNLPRQVPVQHAPATYTL